MPAVLNEEDGERERFLKFLYWTQSQQNADDSPEHEELFMKVARLLIQNVETKMAALMSNSQNIVGEHADDFERQAFYIENYSMQSFRDKLNMLFPDTLPKLHTVQEIVPGAHRQALRIHQRDIIDGLVDIRHSTLVDDLVSRNWMCQSDARSIIGLDNKRARTEALLEFLPTIFPAEDFVNKIIPVMSNYCQKEVVENLTTAIFEAQEVLDTSTCGMCQLKGSVAPKLLADHLFHSGAISKCFQNDLRGNALSNDVKWTRIISDVDIRLVLECLRERCPSLYEEFKLANATNLDCYCSTITRNCTDKSCKESDSIPSASDIARLSDLESCFEMIETVSDGSDFEVRIRQLNDELRRQRKKHELLKTDRKKRARERLRAQEDYLKKQIEAYDKYIIELRNEKIFFEQGTAKAPIKPKTKQSMVITGKSPKDKPDVSPRKRTHDAEHDQSSSSEERDGSDSSHTSSMKVRDAGASRSHLRTIEMQHDESGSLGLGIAGGVGSSMGDVPLVIANLTPKGPAEKGGLRVRDKILMINNKSTDGMSHDEAVAVLKSTSPITLQVVQGEEFAVSVNGSRAHQVNSDVSNDPAAIEMAVSSPDIVKPSQCKTVTLEKGSEGFGFSISGGYEDIPIYVHDILTQSAAAENEKLKLGDKILAVNGKSLVGLTQEEAANILKNANGKVTLSVLS